MQVIDYWLSNYVYPIELKMYEKKMICTNWDLCSGAEHSMTGFSGTNDTKELLPLHTAQSDLDELKITNDEVIETIKLPKNNVYEHLEQNVSGEKLLEKLVEKRIPIFLDAGALMLDFSNDEMARKWLKKSCADEYDAAVCFDTQNIIQSIDRNGVIIELNCSVYRDNLERCLVYLDDVHTRGTDLKCPPIARACVTLSGDITRDKTIQACMRMRQLQSKQSVEFWASYEAHAKIRKVCDLRATERIQIDHVVEFIEENSVNFVKNNIGYWALAAHNYAKKQAAHERFGKSNVKADIKKMSNHCLDNECSTLNELYAHKKDVVCELSEKQFNDLIEDHSDHPKHSERSSR